MKVIAKTTPIIFSKTPFEESDCENLKRNENLEEIKKVIAKSTIAEIINLFREILTLILLIAAPLLHQSFIE